MIIDHVKLLAFANRLSRLAAVRLPRLPLSPSIWSRQTCAATTATVWGCWLPTCATRRPARSSVNQTPEIVSDIGTISVWDARAGYGQVIARQAVEWAIEAARKHGVAVNGLRNAHHIGRVGTYGEIAARAGMVALHFVNVASGPPPVAPFRGREGRFLTNPVCIAIPGTAKTEPILLDFATSRVAMGKVRVAHNSGKPMLDGALLDHAGQPTTDPSVMYSEPRGVVLPFGEHKGSGLALVCELLAGAIVGSASVTYANAAPARHHQRNAQHRHRPRPAFNARQHDGRDRHYDFVGEIGQSGRSKSPRLGRWRARANDPSRTHRQRHRNRATRLRPNCQRLRSAIRFVWIAESAMAERHVPNFKGR